METKSLRLLIKGSLMLIGLFAVLYCGVAVILLNSSDKFEISKNSKIIETKENNVINKDIKITKTIEITNKMDCKSFIFFSVLIIAPLIVFLMVFCFVKKYYNSINKKNETYFNQTEKDRENNLKMKKIELMGETCITLAKAIKPDSDKNAELLREIQEIFSKMNL